MSVISTRGFSLFCDMVVKVLGAVRGIVVVVCTAGRALCAALEIVVGAGSSGDVTVIVGTLGASFRIYLDYHLLNLYFRKS